MWVRLKVETCWAHGSSYQEDYVRYEENIPDGEDLEEIAKEYFYDAFEVVEGIAQGRTPKYTCEKLDKLPEDIREKKISSTQFKIKQLNYELDRLLSER